MVKTRLISIIRKEFIQIIRDPRTLAITFALPLMMLFLLGYAATNDVRNVALVVVDQDHSAASRALLDAFEAADYFQVAYSVDSEAEMRALIDNNSARAGLVIPPGFEDQITGGQTGIVAFIIDGTDPTVAGTAQSAAVLIGQYQATQLSIERLDQRGMASLFLPAVEVRTQVLYNPAMVSAYFMIPALIGMIMQFLTTFLTATSIVRERERGTIEQLIVTPIRPWELVVGKLVPYVFISFLDALLILVAGVLVFGIPFTGSLALFLVLCALFLVTTLGIGLLVSSIASTQQEAMLITMFTVYPSIFLSGFIFPLSAMPQVLQWFSYVVPLRYFLIIARGIVLKGVGMESFWFEVVALVIFAVVVMGLAASRFRKTLD